jgi:16S rRNA (guanine1207-N2)-methyltransferase/23S rRNA (guanine1835-N2)-methyltransferase
MINVNLKRYPIRENDSFQAWNSADEYIIDYIEENNLLFSNPLIIEDEFGALSLSINSENKYLICDSILSEKGIIQNLINNNQDIKSFQFLSAFSELPDNIDAVIMKIPKNTVYLQYLISGLNYYLRDKTPIIAGIMQKYQNKSIFDCFEKSTCDYHSTLARKKARLLLAYTRKTQDLEHFINYINDYNLNLINYPNCFSYEKTDIGARFFIENFQTDISKPENIIDLACGNGILGITCAKRFPEAVLHFSDISNSALLSAEQNMSCNLPGQKCSFYRNNSLEAFEDDFADLIVCNPPFHDQHKISLDTSFEMFSDAKRVLRNNGELLIVANSHLGYQAFLNRLFGNCRVIAQNKKFNLFQIKLTKLKKN